MSANSKIEWCDHTANFWWGCVEVSPGCDHCYARELAKRYGKHVWGVHAPRYLTKAVWKEVPRWQQEAKSSGIRRRVFCQSMSDIGEVLPAGHPQCADIGLLRHRVFTELIPACPDLDFLLLTKRIGNMEKVVPEEWLSGRWPGNVWMGISVVNQEEADRDIPKLLKLPAGVRFISAEPLLGPVDLLRVAMRDKPDGRSFGIDALNGVAWVCSDQGECGDEIARIDWVIVGGESGPHARPMHPDWARLLRDQCQQWGVSFLFKQWGEWRTSTPEECRLPDNWPMERRKGVPLHCFCNPGQELDTCVSRVGKAAAGRLLDGREWNELPKGIGV